jgi:hypothetical protein
LKGRPTIGPLHPRVVATFALIPITVAIEVVLLGVVQRLLFSWWPLTTAGWWLRGTFSIVVWIAPLIVFYAGGLIIWWPTVRWTAQRRQGVVITTCALILVLTLAGLTGFVDADLQFFVALPLASLLGGSIALITVSRICWEPLRGREYIPCPHCGYDLRGQRECRCPECGSQFTVGQLCRHTDDDLT